MQPQATEIYDEIQLYPKYNTFQGFIIFYYIYFCSLADTFIQNNLQLKQDTIAQGPKLDSLSVLGFELITFRSVVQTLNHRP